jgi:hypothetical protein
MYSILSWSILGHQKLCWIGSIVLSWPKCPTTWLLCSVFKITFRAFSGTQSNPLRYNNPSGSSKSFSFPSGLCALPLRSLEACWYAASSCPAYLISCSNCFVHFDTDVERYANCTAEQQKTVPSPPVLIAEIVPKCFSFRTVCIGWSPPPPFSGRYSGHLDSASGLPLLIPFL